MSFVSWTIMDQKSNSFWLKKEKEKEKGNYGLLNKSCGWRAEKGSKWGAAVGVQKRIQRAWGVSIEREGGVFEFILVLKFNVVNSCDELFLSIDSDFWIRVSKVFFSYIHLRLKTDFFLYYVLKSILLIMNFIV